MKNKVNEDIILVGAGLTGLTFCNFLKETDMKIAIFDVNPEEFYNTFDDNRHIVLSNTSKIILSNMGIWGELENYCTEIKNIHISKKHVFGNTIVSAKDENIESLGYQIPLKRLLNKLYQSIKLSKNIRIYSRSEVASVIQDDIINVKFIRNKKEETISSRALIFTSGSQLNIVKDLFQPKIQKDYKQNAIVCEVLTDLHDSITAFERFTDDGILGVIPRKKNSWTLIYSTNFKESGYINELSKSELKDYFQNLIGSKCGGIIDIKNLVSYPLKLNFYENFTNKNTCLLGDAAHTLHPIAGQSFNLSVRDCLEITKMIKQYSSKGNINFSHIFSDYENNRKKEVQRIVKFTDFLSTFVHGRNIVKNKFISLFLLAIDSNKTLRVDVIRYLLGVNFSDKLISDMKNK